MPSRQRHRGPHPADDRMFGARPMGALRRAVSDLSYLYTRGYSEDAAVKLVGDKYQLAIRQRRAVRSAACSDASLAYRQTHVADGVCGEDLCIDGYNLLIAAESALSGAYLFRGRDGYLRDLASLHRSYRLVDETRPALAHVGTILNAMHVREVLWYFDAPVSNSGRLRTLVMEVAECQGWPWRVELATNVDKLVAGCDGVAITSDSWILDRATRAYPLLDAVIDHSRATCPVVDLGHEDDPSPSR